MILKEKIKELSEINIPLSDKNSLMGGNAGISIWLFYLSRYLNDKKYEEIAFNLTNNIVESIGQTNNFHTLCNGYAGIVWALLHLKENEFIDFDIEDIEGIDKYLYYHLINDLNFGNWDYLHGATGLILYFVKKYPYNKEVKDYLKLYLTKMMEIAIVNEKHIKWYSKIDNDNPIFNISLSHGMCGILGILLKIYNIIKYDELKTIIEKNINYILDQQLDLSNFNSYFPSTSIESSQRITSSRMGWCYGDLGIAYTLYSAANILENDELSTLSINIFKHSSKRRDLIECSIFDAGICHGSSGIAHIFRKMYLNTGICEFKDACDYWLGVTMHMAKHTDGLAGYKQYLVDGSRNDYGLLTGIAGIGMVLLSSEYDIKSNWDECLLLS